MDLDSNEWRNLNYHKRKWFVQDDVVISGVSGRFPKSENVQQFKDNLFNKMDMMTGGNARFPSGKSSFLTNRRFLSPSAPRKLMSFELVG